MPGCGRLLSTLLPCSPVNHATMRNRTHRVAAEIEASSNADPADQSLSNKGTVVMIDGNTFALFPAIKAGVWM